ncbi:putative polygalacturonase [Phytophthora cinnamomi]|uniref:putative polygalacturonase n=1 Tax=Phytophthora cinnamomi TaxID=4785 RepID=UPI00355A5BB5|nr:putative polygalacturonase [Phytophthora cinnamomi]
MGGQDSWYWEKGQSIARLVFFKLKNVISPTVSGFIIKKMSFRTSSIVTSKDMMLRGLTIDNRTGNGIAKNTDSFDLTKNDHITITGNKIYNQDDYLAMQSSANTSTIVQGLTVQIENSDNDIRIKTIIGLKGLVPDV